MGLFSFGKKSESILLIDVGSASVAGALAVYAPGAQPAIHYRLRLPVELYTGENLTEAMLRTLGDLLKRLLEEGGPTLYRETKSGHIDRILASIGAPWQETRIRVESLKGDKPFAFTHELMKTTVEKGAEHVAGRVSSGESVIATLLNGYETADPFGKHVKRADMVVLSSTIDKKVVEDIEKALRHAYHTHEIDITAFAPVSYAVLRDLYPHQKDFLILEVSGTTTDIAFVKKGLLVGVHSLAQGTHALMEAGRHASGAAGTGLIDPLRNESFSKKVTDAEVSWIENLEKTFIDFSSRHALPRTLFLLADPNVQDFLKRLLDSGKLHTLWLSDEPLSIVPILPRQFTAQVSTKSGADGDAYLAILALYYQKQGRQTPISPAT